MLIPLPRMPFHLPPSPPPDRTSSSGLFLSPPEMNYLAIKTQLRWALFWESLPSLSWAIFVTFFGTPESESDSVMSDSLQPRGLYMEFSRP